MIAMSLAWMIFVRPLPQRNPDSVDFTYEESKRKWIYHDFVRSKSADLLSDEYEDVQDDFEEEKLREHRLTTGKRRWLWKAFYLIA
jgi:hypothetical protein